MSAYTRPVKEPTRSGSGWRNRTPITGFKAQGPAVSPTPMVSPEGVEPSASAVSKQHSSAELRRHEPGRRRPTTIGSSGRTSPKPAWWSHGDSNPVFLFARQRSLLLDDGPAMPYRRVELRCRTLGPCTELPARVGRVVAMLRLELSQQAYEARPVTRPVIAWYHRPELNRDRAIISRLLYR